MRRLMSAAPARIGNCLVFANQYMLVAAKNGMLGKSRCASARWLRARVCRHAGGCWMCASCWRRGRAVHATRSSLGSW